MTAAVTDKKPTRDRILDAALTAFADRGVEATSLDSLAVEIGIRKQTILYWFPSKEQLLLAVVDHAVADLGARLAEAAVTARPGRSPRSGPRRSPRELVRRGLASTSNAPTSASNRRRFDADAPEHDVEAGPDEAELVTEGVGRATLDLSTASASVGDNSARTPVEGAAAALAVPTLEDRLVAVVDATFRLGTTHPQLLAVVREVTRVGPPASTHLAAAVDPLVDTAAAALAPGTDRERIRRALLAAGARVVGMATEAEVRADLGMAPDLAWLRSRRRALIESLAVVIAPTRASPNAAGPDGPA